MSLDRILFIALRRGFIGDIQTHLESLQFRNGHTVIQSPVIRHFDYLRACCQCRCRGHLRSRGIRNNRRRRHSFLTCTAAVVLILPKRSCPHRQHYRAHHCRNGQRCGEDHRDPAFAISAFFRILCILYIIPIRGHNRHRHILDAQISADPLVRFPGKSGGRLKEE